MAPRARNSSLVGPLADTVDFRLSPPIPSVNRASTNKCHVISRQLHAWQLIFCKSFGDRKTKSCTMNFNLTPDVIKHPSFLQVLHLAQFEGRNFRLYSVSRYTVIERQHEDTFSTHNFPLQLLHTRTATPHACFSVIYHYYYFAWISTHYTTCRCLKSSTTASKKNCPLNK